MPAALGAFAAAVVGYAVTFLTSCFTFDFNKPFFAMFKKKLFLINIAVSLSLSLAIGFFVSVPVTPILVRLGRPEPFPSDYGNEVEDPIDGVRSPGGLYT